MINGLLQKLGVDQGMVGRVLGAAAVELGSIGGDKLAATVEENAKVFVRQFAVKTREDLISAIAGPMPPSFAERFRARGYPDATDENIQMLWRDVVASVADQPAESAA